eukprot:Colp12_sorted_trinity150504_noHs@5370
MSCNKLYFHKTDLQGHPCIVFKVGLHNISKRDKYETLRHWIFFIQDFVNRRAEGPLSQFTLIYDRRNTTRQNSDVSMFKKFLRIFEHNYPDLLFRMYVIQPDFVFKYGFSLVRMLTTRRLRNKILMLENNWQNELIQIFGRENLQVEYGGTSRYEYRFDPNNSENQTGI